MFPRWFRLDTIRTTLAPIKTLHATGSGGLSDYHDLNGPEITKWIKGDYNQKLVESIGGLDTMRKSDRDSFSFVCSWMRSMHHALLSNQVWTDAAILQWKTTVDHIWNNWARVTDQPPFPKVHMLRHTADFLARHHQLGRLAESQMESYHAAFHTEFDRIHLNCASDKTERIRRCLADLTLQKVAKIDPADDRENDNPNAPAPVKRPRRAYSM